MGRGRKLAQKMLFIIGNAVIVESGQANWGRDTIYS